MSRLQQKKVGFKQSRQIGEPGTKIKSIERVGQVTRHALEKKIIHTKIAQFKTTLKPKEIIAFDALIKELSLRQGNLKQGDALEDIYANLSRTLSTKETFFSFGLFKRLYILANKAGIIQTK